MHCFCKISSFLLIGITLFLTASCSDLIETDSSNVPEGESACFSLSVTAYNNTIHTRAVSPSNVENAVNNLYVFIFNPDGAKIYGRMFNRTELASGRLIITSISGKNKQIYGVANIELGMMSTTKAQLDAVRSRDDLLTMESQLLQLTTSRGSSFLMSGAMEDASGDVANVTIPAGVSTATSIGSIRLRRVDSKVTFNISTPAGVTFTPKDWRVVRLPRNVSLVSSGSRDLFTQETDYFNSNWINYEGEGVNIGKTFSFYVLENLHEPRSLIPTIDGGRLLTLPQRYALRQKQEKNPIVGGKPGQTVENGDFIYANDKSTYVQMRGSIEYSMGGGTELFADVVYRIHLGFVNDNVDDYDNVRNSYYIYNVRIESVDKISVEVETNEEQQPGAEGEVTISTKVYSYDSHYDALPVKFTADVVDETLTWSIRTPFDEGINDGTRKDYRWMLFKLNPKSWGSYYQQLVAYPGDHKIMNSKDPSLDSFVANPDSLINIDQLIILLKKSKKRYVENGNNPAGTLFDNMGNVYFSTYVNENYYERNPMDGSAPVDLWKRFVNQPERVMHILLDTKYSEDGQSLRSTSLYTFRQSSIQTMFNIHLPALQTAWGTERLQDDNLYAFWNRPTGIYRPNYNSNSNGRRNTLLMWGIGNTASERWDKYIDMSTHAMNPTYNYARYTCMQRNRDVNGDGLIEKSEIQWYLASINQLMNLWIGENSFDLEARLYKETWWNQNKQWYVSSTVRQSQTIGGRLYDNPMILWSSEGSSIGSMSTINTLYYRCVRNLGIPRTSDVEPEVFATYESSTGIISLDKLDSRSIRGYTQVAELQEHHERQPDNLPYWKFQVYKGTHGNNLNWIQVRDRVNSGNSPCPAGWRVPNQRELSLMLYLIGNDGNWTLDNHMTRTSFSFDPINRPGFAVKGGATELFMINNLNERGGVRCVRDVVAP